MDGRKLEAIDAKASKLSSLSKGVTSEKRDVFVVGRVELALLMHLALRGLDVQCGAGAHGITAGFKKRDGRRDVRKDVLRDNCVDVIWWRELKFSAWCAPEPDKGLVTLGTGQWHKVRSRVYAKCSPPTLLELVQLRPIVTCDLYDSPSIAPTRRCFSNDLVCKPPKVFLECPTCARLV